ncbi:MAG TPA: enolase C-terminal domain-like protein [Vicinamibacterales bacterium]|nr:enolase C-terminal domain-like protein [Vicinamibacterales bacterium]
MRVVAAELVRLAIPFRFSFAHAAATRQRSDNLILKLTLQNGTVGYGECLARSYVTGETADAVAEWFFREGRPFLAALDLRDRDALAELITRSDRGALDAGGAAGCLVELAVIDAFGKAFGVRASEIFGRQERETATYAGVVGRMNRTARRLLLRRLRDAGLGTAKLKVGFGAADLAALADCRAVLGPDAVLGVDANGAWRADEALSAIAQMQPFNVAFVEQPTARGDRAGAAAVAARSAIPVVLDESVCSIAEAEDACANHLGHGFSVRVSKVGGLRNALRLYDFARERGLRYHVGALVGETGILAAAGRQLALMTEPGTTEGSFGDLLLSEDITDPSVRFGRNGAATRLPGAGLGVAVVASRVARHARADARQFLQEQPQ